MDISEINGFFFNQFICVLFSLYEYPKNTKMSCLHARLIVAKSIRMADRLEDGGVFSNIETGKTRK
jgi:hypothetical protein